jgi:Family of unknown function (DUF6114)
MFGGGTVTHGHAEQLDWGEGRAPWREKPSEAAFLAVAGGLFILFGGIIEAWPSASTTDLVFGLRGMAVQLLGLLGVVGGLSLMVLGVLSFVRPEHHVAFGIAIVGIAGCSLLSFWGGFGLGSAMGLFGGYVALTWRPTTAPRTKQRRGGESEPVPAHPAPATPEISTIHYRG